MAIVFALVVNFGGDEASADAAREVAAASPALPVGDRRIGLHMPLIYETGGVDDTSFLLMSVVPIGVGWGVAADRGHETVRLTAAELTEVGHGLYRLLARFTGYRAARVGWDPEGCIDPAELRRDLAGELAAGTLPGLVLAGDCLADLRGDGFRRFVPGFVWIPYEGQRPSTLTADEPT